MLRLFQTQSFAGTHISRVERRNAGWMYVYKWHREGREAAAENVDSVLIAPALVDHLLTTMRAGNYWQSASTQCAGGQLDGRSVTLEARIGAKYYTIKCRLPRSDSLPRDVEETLASFRALMPDRPRAP